MFFKQQILSLQMEIELLRKDIEQASNRGLALIQYGQSTANKLSNYFGTPLTKNQQQTQAFLAKQMPPVVAGWQRTQWQSWTIKPDLATTLDHAALIRIGELIEQRKNASFSFNVPELAPFIGSRKTIIIRCKNSTRDPALALLQSLVIRTALLLPHQIRYTFCDPANNGGAFLMRRSLPEGLVRETNEELYRDLIEVAQDIRRVKESYLDLKAHALHLLPSEIRINERFEGIFAADFPKGYSRREIEELQKIANSGPDAGKYVFIHYNEDSPLPRDISIQGFENAVDIDLNNLVRQRGSCHFEFLPDPPPDASLQQELLNKVNQAKPPERKLNWDDIVGLPASQWWTERTDETIITPIGGRGNTDTLKLWFGQDKEGKQCVHGMLGAMPGSGKSTLYHVLILGLAIRYSPQELRFYLIDGKEGVELAPYQKLPHTEVVSLHSAPELSRSILTELIAEKERRNNLFKQVGVNDFTSYRKLGQPEGNLPRLLLLVDEYQELFVDDLEGIASSQLLILAQQGRSAGIHMLCPSYFG